MITGCSVCGSTQATRRPPEYLVWSNRVADVSLAPLKPGELTRLVHNVLKPQCPVCDSTTYSLDMADAVVRAIKERKLNDDVEARDDR